MAWIVRLVSVGADVAEQGTDVLHIAKPDDLTELASLGLTLGESKRLLAGVQQEIVAAQARGHAARRPACQGCGTACRRCKAVERPINRLKQARRIATRYEKRAVNYLAMVLIGDRLAIGGATRRGYFQACFPVEVEAPWPGW